MPNGPQGDDGQTNQANDDIRKRDYAIVVGITRYPALSLNGVSADLKGPINDAKAMRAWIESPAGGGVPLSNVIYVTRDSNAAPDTPDPTRDTVVKAFVAMYERCFPGGPSRAPKVPLGRRLYVYASGHGLAASRKHGALLCSNSSNHLYSTLAPYASIEAFRQMGCFEQFVVWFDGCMDWPDFKAEPINYVPRLRGWLPPGPAFTAYAARPRLKAVESPDENGKVHGVFTRTLLAGLKGGAVNASTGLIDGYSLANYLWNAMPKYMPGSANGNSLIDKQPLVKPAQGFVFGPPQKAIASAVAIRFADAHNGALARVWGRKLESQQSLALLAERTITDGQIEVILHNGIYTVDVPEHGLHTSLEITESAATTLSPDSASRDRTMVAETPREIETAERSEAISQPDGEAIAIYELRIETGDPTTQIVVLDDRFNAVAKAVGSIAQTLPAGLYKIRVQRGASSLGFTDKLVVLDRDSSVSVEPPQFVSPAPIAGTRASEAHVAALERLDGVVHIRRGEGSKIAILARYTTPKRRGKNLLHPFRGLQLLRADGRLVVDLEDAAPKFDVPEAAGPISVCGISVDPGAYILRHELAGRDLAQSIVATAGWQITMNIRRSQEDADPKAQLFAGLGYVAPLMRRLIDKQSAAHAPMRASKDGPVDEDQLIDAARQALADGTQLLSGNLYNLLLRDFENPLAGIVGGLLLDLEREATGDDFPSEQAALFDIAVTKLRKMVGREHPDVEALSFRCRDPGLIHRGAIDTRPMFHRSWRIILEAASKRANLVPLDLWKRTIASGSMPPYLIWSREKSTKLVSLRRLRKATSDRLTQRTVSPIVSRGVASGPTSNVRMSSGENRMQASAVSPAYKPQSPRFSRKELALAIGVPANAVPHLIEGPKLAAQSLRSGKAPVGAKRSKPIGRVTATRKKTATKRAQHASRRKPRRR